jgi:hypothetical protein
MKHCALKRGLEICRKVQYLNILKDRVSREIQIWYFRICLPSKHNRNHLLCYGAGISSFLPLTHITERTQFSSGYCVSLTLSVGIFPNLLSQTRLTSSVRHVKRRNWYLRFNSNSSQDCTICKSRRKFESRSFACAIVVSKNSKDVLSFTWNFIVSVWWSIRAFAEEERKERELGAEWMRDCQRVGAWEGRVVDSTAA